jgi:serine/threonine protein kinase
MNKRESGFEDIPFNVSDYEDEPYYRLLRKLPKELAKNHMRYADAQAMTNEEIANYLTEIVANRREAITVSGISDPAIQEIFKGEEAQLFHTLETTVFHNPDNYLGEGMTARVKLFDVQTTQDTKDQPLRMAIKYIITPTAKTLTAEQEHGVIIEVERMRMIEAAEKAFPRRSKYIRVPHPYLYHSTEHVDLYGMECIDGITLEQAAREGMLHQDMKEALRNSQLMTVPKEELDGYIERFVHTMHQYCLHGDIKPRNIMVNREGVLYIIDFGQSVMLHNMPNKSEDAVENLKSAEIEQTKTAVHSLIHKLKTAY